MQSFSFTSSSSDLKRGQLVCLSHETRALARRHHTVSCGVVTHQRMFTDYAEFLFHEFFLRSKEGAARVPVSRNPRTGTAPPYSFLRGGDAPADVHRLCRVSLSRVLPPI